MRLIARHMHVPLPACVRVGYAGGPCRTDEPGFFSLLGAVIVSALRALLDPPRLL